MSSEVISFLMLALIGAITLCGTIGLIGSLVALARSPYRDNTSSH